jgi:hypothetical protein
MSTRRRLALAIAVPAVLLGGPLAGSAMAAPQLPTPAVVAGGSGTLTFAATAEHGAPITRIDLALPVDTPLLGVTVPAVDGWTSATTDTVTPSCGAKAVDHVTWTATGAGDAPQGDFALQVGRFPAAADRLQYSGTVTYADGTVASLADAGTVSAAPPAAPAPTGGWLGRFTTLLPTLW